MPQYEIYSKTSEGLRGDLIEKYSKFTATLRFNEAGKWSMTGKGAGFCPLAENSGIIIYRDGSPFISGYVTKIDEEIDETYEDAEIIDWEASGYDDNGLLTRRIMIPDPVNLDMTAAAYQTIRDYGGDAILEYISTQAGLESYPGRAIPNLTVDDEFNQGDIKSYQARLDNLWEFIIKIAENQSLGVRVIWDGVSGMYEAQVYTPADKTDTVIFSRELGNLKKWKRTREAPKANALWVAGQGELTSRMFSYIEDANSIAKWGRYEGFKDRRDVSNTQDPGDTRTPQEILDESAVDYLAENLETEGYELELAPLKRLIYRTDWELGDIVKVRIGTTDYNAMIEEVQVEYADTVETVTPKVGTIDRGTISKTYQTIQSISDRIKTLEKSEGIVDLFNTHTHNGIDSKKINYSNIEGVYSKNSIELNSDNSLPNYGGFIDFHFNGSHDDYTTRIIEEESGKLSISGDLYVAGHILNVFPVGSIYMSVNSTNPSTYFGGTWVAWGSGRVPVGFDSSQSEFDTVGETGGSKVPALLSHVHPYSGITGNIVNMVGPITSHSDGTTATGEAWNNINSAGLSWVTNKRRHADGTFAHQHNFSGNTSAVSNGNQTNGNLQPYIVCYMWKRTA